MVQSGRAAGLPWNPMPLAAISIVAALSQPVGQLVGVSQDLLAPLALVAGIAGLIRVALWRGAWTRDKPILWTLHLSYTINAAGFLAYGLAGLGIGSEIGALHLVGIGGVGGMTVSVMSRAVLGHTGRALVATGPVAIAYALVPLAALARLGAATYPDLHYPATLTAAVLWILAFTLFTTALWPVFWGPRQGKSVMEPPTS